MYLRLKPQCSSASRSASEPGISKALPQYLRRLLLSRHLSAFDWQNGGPVGAIKFIDLRELEYIARRALHGDVIATHMAQLYLRGMRCLVAEVDGGACQYSIGDSWNGNNRQFTLAGQAVMLQAISVCATVGRRKDLVDIATRIHRFVVQRDSKIESHPLFYNGKLSRNAGTELRLRDRCWYARAVHQFGTAYDLSSFVRDGAALFLSVMRCVDRQDQALGILNSLDDDVAFTASLAHFAHYFGDRQLWERAQRRLIATATRHSHPHGGYQQLENGHPMFEAEIDIDCTIEIVRICLYCGDSRPNPSLRPVLIHGVRGLYDPSNALRRNPESGILLVADALDRTSQHTRREDTIDKTDSLSQRLAS